MKIELNEGAMITLNVWIITSAITVLLCVFCVSCNNMSAAKWHMLTTNGYSEVQQQGSSCTMWQKEAK